MKIISEQAKKYFDSCSIAELKAYIVKATRAYNNVYLKHMQETYLVGINYAQSKIDEYGDSQSSLQ